MGVLTIQDVYETYYVGRERKLATPRPGVEAEKKIVCDETARAVLIPRPSGQHAGGPRPPRPPSPRALVR